VAGAALPATPFSIHLVARRPAMSRHFRFELGFNRSAAPITAPVAPSMVPPSEGPPLYPLQGALILLGSDAPAWCTFFVGGDMLSFRLVDITNLQQPDPKAATPSGVAMAFRDPDTGTPARPFIGDPGSWSLRDANAVMRWSPPYSRSSSQLLPTWDLQAKVGQTEQDQFGFSPVASGFSSCELSVGTRIVRPGEAETEVSYVFDPEIIIGDGGQ
jgi:hypothetical protein